jgi:hypothetical protein
LGAIIAIAIAVALATATIGTARADWIDDTRGALSAPGAGGLRVLVRYDSACRPLLLIGQPVRQRTLKLPWGSVRAAVDGRLIATGEQSPGRRVRLTAGAVTALRQGAEATVSIAGTQLQVDLGGASGALAAARRHCADDTLPRHGGVHWTIIGGDIGRGWARAVMEAVRALGASGLVIDANGGDLAEAERLGQWIRDRGLDTAVTGDCALACAQAFVGGVLRFIAPQARLGLQRPPLRGGEAGIPGAVARQTSYLRGLGVGQARAVAERAAATPPETIDWLGAEEAIALGLATEIGTPGGIAVLPR